MDKNFICTDDIRNFRLPRYSEIPNVGLYLEQTTKYINSYLKPIGFEITGSMIRNYVKMHMLDNPKNKQYYTEHIAYLIAITVLKNIASLDNLSLLFLRQKQIYTEQVAYDYFCNELENMLHYQFGIKDQVDSIGTTHTNEKKMLRSAIIAITHIVYLNFGFKEFSVEQKSTDYISMIEV